MGKISLFVSSFLIILVILGGCERTIEEEVVKPIEAIFEQKNVASLEVAVANVRTVRSALMRYPVTSSENLYPGDMVIDSYDSMRELLPDENLPADMKELLWDPAYGIRYMSDGYTFTFEVRCLGDGRTITATPSGVTVSQ